MHWVIILGMCLSGSLFCQAPSDLDQLETTKIEMLDYLGSFSDLIPNSSESDAQSADALSQIAGEWVIHLTYVITLLELRMLSRNCRSDAGDRIIVDRLEKVISAEKLSRDSINLMLTYSGSGKLHKLAEQMSSGLELVGKRLSHLCEVLQQF